MVPSLDVAAGIDSSAVSLFPLACMPGSMSKGGASSPPRTSEAFTQFGDFTAAR